MKQKLLNKLWLRVGMIVAIMTTALSGTAWAQGDYSTDYTGNVTLSATGGTSASACVVRIQQGTNTVNSYDGIKAGTSKVAGAVKITVPSGTKYLHMHTAAWNGETVALSVSPSGYSSNISLTSDSGVSNNSPFTLGSYNKASTDYYKVITFGSALTANTDLTFTATSGKRFVVWGVTAEEEGSTPLADSNLALTGSTSLNFDLYNNSSAQVINYTTSSTGAITIADNDYATFDIDEENKTITVTPTAVTPSAQTITINQAADESYNSGSTTFTVTITDSTPIPTHTVTFSINGVTTTDEVEEGAAIVFPEDPEAVSGKTFVGWVDEAIDGTTNDAPTFVTSATMGQSDVTYYAVFAFANGGGSSEVIKSYGFETESDPDWTITDAIVRTEGQGNTGSYAGKINTNHTYITFNSKVKVKEFSFAFKKTSTNSNYNVYIETSEDNSTWTAVETYTMGSFNNGSYSTNTKEFDGTQELYVRFHCYNTTAVRYVDDVTIKYVGGGVTYSDYCTTVVAAAVARPVIEVAANPFLFSTTATITCETEGAAIKYSFDGETWNDYTDALTITATTNIYAKAVKDEVESTVASVTATKNLATPTVTVSGDLTLDLDGGTDIDAGTLTAAVTYNDAPVAGATVTWESSNTDVATIDEETGAVTLLTTGEVTFTATYAGNSDYAEATGTKTVTVVDTNAPGSTAENPYTVAQAIDAIDNNGNVTDVYVTGIVSQVDEFNSSYHSITYWISEDGTTTSNQFEVYSGKDIGGVNFSSIDDIQVGDVVVVKGDIKLYNSTYEFNYNNQLVSLTRKEAATITVTGGTEQTVDRTNNEDELTLVATANSGATVVFTLDNTNTTLTEGTDFDFDDGYLAFYTTKGGTITVKANAPAAGNYKAATEVTITITVIGVKADPTIVVNSTETVAYGNTFIVNDSMIKGGDITITSSNTAVATVSGLTITPVAVGTTTITVATAEDAEYKAGSETFTLTVTAPAGTNTAKPGEINCVFTDKDFTNSSSLTWTSEVDGRSFETSGSARGVQIGAAKGEYTINATNTNTVTKVSMVVSTNNAGNTIAVKVGDTDFECEGETSVSLEKDNNYTVEFTGSDAGNIVISVNNTAKTVWFKSITVYTTTGTVTATLNSYGYATFCSQYPLDFTGVTDFSAWQITDISTSNEITFERVTGAVKGGTGLFLKGEAGDINIPSTDSSNDISSTNKLVGTTAPTYFAEGEIYGLAGDTFKKNSAGSIRANKAYIPANLITVSGSGNGGGAKAFTFIFDDEATGIKTIETVSAEEAAQIFNLAGQRINKMQKGINIVNGKKILK